VTQPGPIRQWSPVGTTNRSSGTFRRRRAVPVLVPVVALLAAGCGGGDGAAGANGSSCYQGQRVTFVVPYGPGSGYDTIARAAAPSLEEELGATVVVENQLGAGGLTAANTLYEAEPDGMTIAIVPGVGLLGAALAGTEGVSYDPVKFTFIGRITPDVRLMTVGPTSGLETIEDVLSADSVTFASTGPGGADHIDATVVSQILDLNGEVVSGFVGEGETDLAVISGEVDALFSSVAGQLPSVESGELVPVLVAGQERSKDLPDVPALLELDLDDDQRALAEAHSQLQQAGRSVVAPPGVPEECVNELQGAVETTVDDPRFLEQLEKGNERVQYLPGDELQEVFRSVMEDSPEEYVTLLKSAFEGQ
jgi:tripartite-type tricarboxylate transporter receptor subunit TctC